MGMIYPMMCDEKVKNTVNTQKSHYKINDFGNQRNIGNIGYFFKQQEEQNIEQQKSKIM